MSKTGIYIAPLLNKTAFKIGKANSPERRLAGLSRFYDFDAAEIVTVWCKDESQSFQIESCLHSAFSKHNVPMEFDGGTEFFNYTQFQEAIGMVDILCKVNGLVKSKLGKIISVEKATAFEQVAIKIANKIKAERLKNNLSQSIVAKLAGVSKRSVERVENGGDCCNLNSVIKIACALKMQDNLFNCDFEMSQRKRAGRILVGLSDHEPEREGWIYNT